MRLHGFEPWTPALSEQCSSQAELQPHIIKKNKSYLKALLITLLTQELTFHHRNHNLREEDLLVLS